MYVNVKKGTHRYVSVVLTSSDICKMSHQVGKLKGFSASKQIEPPENDQILQDQKTFKIQSNLICHKILKQFYLEFSDNL